jgi:hypothetical protein
MTFVGGGVLVFAWAGLIAWLAKLAQSRGRFIVGWAIGGGLCGLVAFGAGLGLVTSVIDSDASTGLMLLTTLAPPLFMLGAMLVIGIIIVRMPIRVAARDKWSVHFLNRGEGRISIDGDAVHFTWPDGSREARLDQLHVEADGEVVRIGGTEGGEIVALMTGKPDSSAGRRQQSQALARRLRANVDSIPRATALPPKAR